jgi:hypothetical protein
MTVHIHVERMVLVGLDLERAGAEALRDAVGAELGRLFETHDPAAGLRDGAVPTLRAPAVAFAQDASPAQIGAQVAGAVYGSLGG